MIIGNWIQLSRLIFHCVRYFAAKFHGNVKIKSLDQPLLGGDGGCANHEAITAGLHINMFILSLPSNINSIGPQNMAGGDTRTVSARYIDTLRCIYI